MDKNVIVNSTKFSHQLGDNLIEFIEAADSEKIIVSAKRNKEQITTTLTKADLFLLVEFLKNRGIK